MANVKLLASSYSSVLTEDLLDENNNVLARAGDRVVFVPITHYRAVMCGNNSLEDLWNSLSKVGHTHQELVDFQTSQVRAMDRLTQLELWAATNGYPGYTPSSPDDESES